MTSIFQRKKSKSSLDIKLDRIKRSAELRGYSCTLTLANIERLLEAKTCAYTGIEFDSENNISFERVDNSRGYEPGNVIPVIIKANQLKSGLDLDGLIELKQIFETKHSNKIIELKNRANGARRKIKNKEVEIAKLQKQLNQQKIELERDLKRISEIEAGDSEAGKNAEIVGKIINHIKEQPNSGRLYMTRWQKINAAVGNISKRFIKLFKVVLF